MFNYWIKNGFLAIIMVTLVTLAWCSMGLLSHRFALNLEGLALLKEHYVQALWFKYAAGDLLTFSSASFSTNGDREGLAETVNVNAGVQVPIALISYVVQGTPIVNNKLDCESNQKADRRDLCLLFYALITANKGSDSEAISVLESLGAHGVLHGIGRELLKLNNPKRASLYLLAAYNLHPPGAPPAYKVYLDQSFRERVQFTKDLVAPIAPEAAYKEYQTIVAISPDRLAAGLASIEIARMTRDPVERERLYREVIAAFAGERVEWLAREALAQLLLQQERYCALLHVALRGIELQPEVPDFYYYTGRAYEGLQAWSWATVYYELALKRFPGYQPYLQFLENARSQAEIEPTSPSVECKE